MTEPTTTDRQQAMTEYAVGAAGLWSRDAWRTLPSAFDDTTRDFGDDFYDRVDLEPVASANKNVLKASVIEEGVRVEAAVSDELADGYDLAHEIEEFCESVLADLQISIDDVLWDMCDAFAYGSRMAEQVYSLHSATAYALPGTSPISRTQDMLILSALKPKPRQSVAFVVDAFMNVTAIQAQLPGTGWSMLGTMDKVSAARVPGVLPRHKFAVLSFRPKDSDPRGTSIYRQIYEPWFAKQQIWQEFLKYLAQFAGPSIYATASEEASKNGVLDENGVKQPATTVLLNTLLAFQNGTAAVFPYGTLLNLIQSSGEGQAFHRGFTHCDQQITIAILHQLLATQEGQHQARAASQTHQDVLDTVIRQIKRSVARMLHRDVLCPLIAANYGDTVARSLTPHVSLGGVEQHDFASFATAIASLTKASYLDPSQFAGVDELLGLPKRVATPAPAPGPGQPAAEDEEDDDESL